MKTLHAFYDLTVSPLTFDVIFLLAAASAAVEKGEYDAFHYHVVLPPIEDGKFAWRMHSPKDHALSDEEKFRRVVEILAPIGASCRHCAGSTVHWNRESVEAVFTRPGDGVLPNGYTGWSPRGIVSAQQLFTMFTDDPEVLCKTFTSSPAYNNVYQRDEGTLTVSFDMRVTKVHAEKNTDINLVRDVAADLLTTLHKNSIVPINIYDKPLTKRIAAMAQSDLHFSMSGGPNFIPFFMENTRALVWLNKESDPGLTSQQRLSLLGLGNDFGQWPTANNQRKFIWCDKPPTAEQMVKEIELCLT